MSSYERQILSALTKGAQIDAFADGPGIAERQVREHIARARVKQSDRAAPQHRGAII